MLKKIKSKDQYCLKYQKSFNKSGIYETLHNVIRNHYKIPAETNLYK